jgi:hypothetical protein
MRQPSIEERNRLLTCFDTATGGALKGAVNILETDYALLKELLGVERFTDIKRNEKAFEKILDWKREVIRELDSAIRKAQGFLDP